eukprot:7116986-Prymnesium_polylepis.1
MAITSDMCGHTASGSRVRCENAARAAWSCVARGHALQCVRSVGRKWDEGGQAERACICDMRGRICLLSAVH